MWPTLGLILLHPPPLRTIFSFKWLGNANKFSCAAPQLPLLNLQECQGCLSGHRDEEEGTIDWVVAQRNTCERIPAMKSAKKINWDAAAAVVEEELIVRLVFSSSLRLRHHKLSSLDRYWWQRRRHSVSEVAGRGRRRRRRSNSGRPEQPIGGLYWLHENLNPLKDFPYQWRMASASQTRALCPVVTDFLQAAVAPLCSFRLFLHLGPKKSFWSGCAQGRRY